jgi:hypothetical protein
VAWPWQRHGLAGDGQRWRHGVSMALAKQNGAGPHVIDKNQMGWGPHERIWEAP